MKSKLLLIGALCLLISGFSGCAEWLANHLNPVGVRSDQMEKQLDKK
jgi:hypothetical protein